nr:hypothetical protein [Tanacetum cinerariifolium]
MPITNVPDEAIYEEWDDSLERASIIVTSLDAAHYSGNILKTQSKAMPNVPLPQGIGTSGSPRCPLLRLAKVLADAAKKKVNTYTRRRRVVSSGSEGVSNASKIFSTAKESISTAGESMSVSTADVVDMCINTSFIS